jgi:hypothetical protein
MAEVMSEQGTRLRRSLLAVGFIVVPWVGLGCESSSAAARVSEAAAPSQPERVVQHMAPNPTPIPGPAAASGSARLNVEASAAGASRSPEPITSKHLEAELNRLEAELAN